MNHAVTYFGPNECLSKQKRYLRYKRIKSCRMTTRPSVGWVRDLNSRMAQLPPLFEDSQVLYENELVDSLANKALRSHKAMLINQGLILRQQLLRTLSSTASAQKPPTTLPGRSSLPLTRTSSLGGKSAPRLRVIAVRNESSNPPRYIALSMETIPVTIQRIVTF